MFYLKTTAELADLARSKFRAFLKGSDAKIWPNNVYASAKVIGGMVWENNGFISYVSRQIFAHTAPDMETLLLHGAEFKVPRKAATPSQGAVTLTVDGAVAVAVNAVLRQPTTGLEYLVTAAATRGTAGPLQVSVTAAVDGAASNAMEGTNLDVVSGVTGAGAATATALVGPGDMSLGAEVEGFDDYQARILFRKRNPPHGGAPSDYVIWAGEVSGVTRVFVERRWAGPGTVRVFVLMDDLFPPNGIPDAAAVARVKYYLDTVEPAVAVVSVVAPAALPINVTISGLKPNTPDVQNAVRAELADTFKRRGRASGNDTEHGGMPFLATPESFSRSWIAQAVANATGEDRDVLVAPASDTTIPSGSIATLGTVNFV